MSDGANLLGSMLSQSIPLTEPGLLERAREAIDAAVRYLLSLQAREGYWVGELQADTTLESDYILYLHVIGRFDRERVAKLSNYIRRKQLPDGGWNIFEGSPAELNATVKAYFALKLAGDSPGAAHMARARRRIHELGGLEATNSFTRFYLALVGAVGWEMVPAIPVEMLLLPTWLRLNIYEMSSWSRAIVVPLTILYALKPSWTLPEHARIEELFADPARRKAAFDWDRKLLSWRNFFFAVDRAYKLYEQLPFKPLRDRALGKARRWMTEHLERSEGLGAIYPAMVNSVFALLAMGYAPDDPLTAREIGHLAKFEIEEDDTVRVQPCLSPIWDTAIALFVLGEAGLSPEHPAMVQGARWLLEQQILGPGDWQVKNRKAEPGGWAFEFRNDFYPDVDDTSFVLMALQRVAYPERKRLEEAVRRGTIWMLSMQNRDGGWGAFDRENDCYVFTQVPYADHNAMIDPSTADLTARVVECLGRFGWPATHPVMRRALAYLRREQTQEGAWYGRWGVNFIYGTSSVLRGFEAVRQTANEYCQRAIQWLRAVQNPDGGFGESILSYYDESKKGQGESTPSQTAWGLLGLLASARPTDPAVTGAVQFLLDRQNVDGSWDEMAFTGTGFPRVFYLKYHLYRNYFPLYALARYCNRLEGGADWHAFKLLPQHLNGRNGHRRKQ